MTKLLALAIAGALALTLAGCGGSSDDTVLIGIGGPVTGSSASFGQQLKRGGEQAVVDINKAGGILGKKVASEVGDDVGDPKQGVSVANKFVADGVKFVVGHFNSGVTIPAGAVYNENGIVEITPASTNPQVTERGLWNVFRICGRDDQQGSVAGDYIAAHFADKKVAIVDDKTTYGKGLADEARKRMNEKGVKEVLDESISVGDKDFSSIVSKIKESGADLVYWGGLQTEGGLLVRQMRGQGVNAILMGGDGIASDEFASIAGPGAVGTLMTYGPDPRKRPEAKAVVDEFRAQNFDPEAYTLYSYAAVQVFKQAAEAAQSLDPKKVAEKMTSGMTFKTVIGDFSFNKKGDVNRLDYVVYRWQKNPDGKITYAEISDQASAAPGAVAPAAPAAPSSATPAPATPPASQDK
ncbi:MAG TPA: branched-chain amino acid ABC transporter substrate-binding protein [Xanthobacteraceae bacterium]|jgi:branched-chain amino acid transport system substrate-binding protein|nr:branched-chain amino acid ABC transporter substrate-binding protein [Xanthobacteraceae bacterium]